MHRERVLVSHGTLKQAPWFLYCGAEGGTQVLCKLGQHSATELHSLLELKHTPIGGQS